MTLSKPAKKPKGRAAISTAIAPVEYAQRLLLAIILGYFFTVEVSGLAGLLLTSTLARSEAAALSAMIAFLLYTFVILWAFADRSLLRLWIVIPGGGLLCYGLSRFLAMDGVV
ncbi:MAG: iron uptake protein [Gammaproteobacteria bacterium]|nr:iron uptake protein [Gammaproteobacteria bacterium]